MNRRPTSSSLPAIPKLIEGFTQFKAAEGLSSRTIDSYTRILSQWDEYVRDKNAGKITPRIIVGTVITNVRGVSPFDKDDCQYCPSLRNTNKPSEYRINVGHPVIRVEK